MKIYKQREIGWLGIPVIWYSHSDLVFICYIEPYNRENLSDLFRRIG